MLSFNWKTFTAVLMRDGHVARRKLPMIVLQTMAQPLLFVFIFGKVLVRGGMVSESFKSILVPGLMAMTMMTTGIQAVSVPLLTEILTKEIEDRLLAPMEVRWVALAKVTAGMVQALVAGAMVIPFAIWILGASVGIDWTHLPLLVGMVLLVALLATSAGLAMGCSVDQANIGLLFTIVLGPVLMFGCVYYPWNMLSPFPILQKAVLLNPVVYASEGLRGAMVPKVPHIAIPIVLAVLVAIDAGLLIFGLRQFYKKAVS
jgi:ABC-2 type transport system permease protein